VLILDEATSALDGLTEQEVLATLRRLHGLYTTILIAHQSATMRSCDRIFVFEQGRITAGGTYDELLDGSVAFRHLVRATSHERQPPVIA
jgi:ABC-type bacteriocin/lantibiotic exporter with double-glycine peptidase domain